MAIFTPSREPTGDPQNRYSIRTLAQVRLLMEHLSALQDRKLSDLEITLKGNSLKGAALLERIYSIIDK